MSLWDARYFNVRGGLSGNISLVHRRRRRPPPRAHRRPICIRVLSSFEKNIPTQPARGPGLLRQLLPRHTSPSAWYWWPGKRLSKSHTRIIYEFVVVYLPGNLFHALFSKNEIDGVPTRGNAVRTNCIYRMFRLEVTRVLKRLKKLRRRAVRIQSLFY